MDKEINEFITKGNLPVKQIKRLYRRSKDDLKDKFERFEIGKEVSYLDDQQFIKIYPTLIYDMIHFNKVDTLLFQYICEQLLINVERYKDEEKITQYHSIDRIKLNAKELSIKFDSNDRNIRNSRNKFIKSNILAKAIVPDYYWINPYKLFIGDRAAKYKTNLKVINNNAEREYAYELIDAKLNSHDTKTK